MQSYRSPFVAPFEQRNAAKAAHAKFCVGKSDLVGFAVAYTAWEEVGKECTEECATKDFCLFIYNIHLIEFGFLFFFFFVFRASTGAQQRPWRRTSLLRRELLVVPNHV